MRREWYPHTNLEHGVLLEQFTGGDNGLCMRSHVIQHPRETVKLWTHWNTVLSQREYNIKNKQTKDRRETTTTIQPPQCSLQKYPLKSENFFYFDSSETTFPTTFVLASRSYVLDFACGYPWGNLHTGTQNFDKRLSGVCFHLCKFILLTQLCGWKG